jgi:signal transduction histidine kinase
MDRMMTPSTFAVTQAQRLRANWPALLLPVLAAEMICLVLPHKTASWAMPGLGVVLALAAAVTVLAPAAAARMAPFALFGYGCVGLIVAHRLLTWQSVTLFYGVLNASRATGSMELVLPEAFIIMAASVWLLVATGGPGSAAVRRAMHQLCGTGGQPRTVPALLLLPVLGLWEEAYANALWFGSEGVGDLLVAVMIGVVGVVLVARYQRLAAVAAVIGVIGLGLILFICALNGSAEFIYYALSGPFWNNPQYSFPQEGVFSGLYGPVLLDGQAAVWLTRAEAVLLVVAGVMLVPRMVGWAADAELVRRATFLTQRVDRLARTRSDATSTAVTELRRIERDLHDGAQARLVAVGMALRAAEQLMPTSPEAALALIGEARETSSRALADLRDLVRGIYPPVLADRGLADAVRTLALDSPMTVETDITLSGEPSMPIAAAVYFGIAEVLTNAVRHSGADTVEIGIGYAGGLLRATVTDDGTGGADVSRGTGLAGVERRLATFDGILAISSPPGGPTIIAMEVPCELSSADAVRAAHFSWQEKSLLTRG